MQGLGLTTRKNWPDHPCIWHGQSRRFVTLAPSLENQFPTPRKFGEPLVRFFPTGKKFRQKRLDKIGGLKKTGQQAVGPRQNPKEKETTELVLNDPMTRRSDGPIVAPLHNIADNKQVKSFSP
jgi:hypothetical protein